ncbi:DUF2934 domain-containing protein [Prosthecobacter sp.]|uniref:DUF2934 domain-containing protein n=1 Tax=Prosthecobacter sp. TaxID=1965333 RepID=UPI002AB853F6|nr:DUF2934 domain-containing protein [Prosthecobacter sp.]MDZ4401743.1 hypothetical protein [Prosthecobacter sp.]
MTHLTVFKPGAAAPQNHTLTSFAPSTDEVAYRAYLNYQNHGGVDGHDVKDWFGAQAELIAEHHLTMTL